MLCMVVAISLITNLEYLCTVVPHRANFNSPGDFAICSRHFEVSCFERPLHMPGSRRRLLPGSVPTIWRDREEKPISARRRRKVSLHNFRCHCFIFVLYFHKIFSDRFLCLLK